jgi:hypothetical protein
MSETNEHSLIVELIHSEFNALSKNQNLQRDAILNEMKLGFEAINKRIDSVVEQKIIQNGRIGKLETKVINIDSRTKLVQLIHRYPVISIAVSVIFVSGILYLNKYFTLLDLFKSIF